MERFIWSIFSALSFMAGCYFSFFISNPSLAVIWLTIALFFFLFGWPEKAESISFLGSSIKLRKIKHTIDELKKLAEINSKVLLDLIKSKGRFSSPESCEEEQKTYEEIENMLKIIGFSINEVEKIQLRWHQWTERDYISNLVLPNSNINHPEIPKESKEKWDEKRNNILENIEIISEINISPDDLKKTFEELGAYTPKVKSVIDDYDYYKKYKRHRDIEEWKKRDKWFK